MSRSVPIACALLALSWTARSQNQQVQSFSLNAYKRQLDGQWLGTRYASDGNVYFGSSSQSAHHGAMFFKYDPRTQQVTLLGDVTAICGEDQNVNPQGKLHSDIVEANGWLYFGTHFGVDNPIAYPTWSGSHVVGYNLATGQFRDYGVTLANYDSYSAVGVDPVRNYIYHFVTGQSPGQVTYLFRIDAITGAKTNLGQIGGTYYACLYFFIDQRGDVWISQTYDNGTLRRVHGDTGLIDVYPNALPPLYLWNVPQIDPSPDNQYYRSIHWMQKLDGNRAVFTLGNDGGMLYLFDSTKPIGSGQEFQNIQHIGYSDLGLALGNNRVFYYQRANRGYGHQGDQTPDGIRDFHLLSVSLNAADGYAITDHGLIVDQDGRLVWRVPAMMTDGQSRVFMTGDWWTLPGDLGTLRYNYSNGVESYLALPRGEYFAVANVTIPTTTPVVSVSVGPPGVTLTAGQTQQFTATVTGSSDTAVVWSLNIGAPGTISTGGLYTAPSPIATTQYVTVTATSHADGSKSGSITLTLQAPAPPVTFTPIRVRAGGAAYTDPLGQVWAADTGYSGGSAFLSGSAIANTTTPALYQGERWSLTPFQYQFTVPAGNYQVNLKFSENFATAAGQRTFNVAVNGTAMLTNFDIFAQAGGGFRALDQSIVVAATNQVTIALTPVIGAAKLDAIEILQSGGATTPVVSVSVGPPGVTLTAGQPQQFTATVTGSADTAVVWSLNTGAPGTITTGGLYTAPSPIATTQYVTVIATSHADGSKSGSITLTLQPPASPPPTSTFTPIRVRAGGPAYTDALGQIWAADTGYSGGTAYMSGSAIANTSTPALYQGERWSVTPFQYQFTVPAGNYQVNLKFSENFATAAGQRTFNVAVNGTAMLTNFDIFAQAGGGFRALDQSIVVAATNQVTIALTPVVGAAKLDAIEILQSGGTATSVVSVSVGPPGVALTAGQPQQFTATVTGSADTAVVWSLNTGAPGTITTGGLYTAPSPIATTQYVTVTATSHADSSKSGSTTLTLQAPAPPVTFTPIRVRAGGPAYTDPLGQIWAADTGYSGGTAYMSGSAIANTATPALYQGERWSVTPFQYQFTVPAGNYQVNLKFSENFATAAGQRTFNVTVNGTAMLTNFDIFAQAGGGFRALDQSIVVAATNQVTIALTPVVGAAKLDAIEILQSGATTPVVSVSVGPPGATLTAGQPQQFTATVTGSADTAVVWSLNTGAPGTITTGGLYTAPSPIATTQYVTVTATSHADSSKSGSITLTLQPPASPPPVSTFTPIRVRAGGVAYTDPLGQVWAADTGYSGGTAYSTGSAIANTTTPALYQGERWSVTPFQYQFTVPAGNYQVNLKFSENFATAAGQRTFNVTVNGTAMLTNFDILAQAGGGFRALDQSIVVAATNQVTIALTPVVGAAKLDAIEILQSGGTATSVVSVSVGPPGVALTAGQPQQFTATVTGSADTAVVWSLNTGAPGTITTGGLYTAPSPIATTQYVTVTATSHADSSKSGSITLTLQPPAAPPPTSTFTPIRVRAGGVAYTDPLGQVWAADTGYSGGTAYSTGSAIANTTTPALYQGERWSLTPFQYQFTVPAGNYHVNLKFSENFATAAGQRTFNVTVNGTAMLTNFDIFAQAGGGFRALDQSIVVAATSQVIIVLTPVLGAAKIDAIEIY